MSTEMDTSALGAMNAALHMEIENCVGQENLSWNTSMSIVNATQQSTSLSLRKSLINWDHLMSSKRNNFKQLIMVLEEVEAAAVVLMIEMQVKHIKILLWIS